MSAYNEHNNCHFTDFDHDMYTISNTKWNICGVVHNVKFCNWYLLIVNAKINCYDVQSSKLLVRWQILKVSSMYWYKLHYGHSICYVFYLSEYCDLRIRRNTYSIYYMVNIDTDVKIFYCNKLLIYKLVGYYLLVLLEYLINYLVLILYVCVNNNLW